MITIQIDIDERYPFMEIRRTDKSENPYVDRYRIPEELMAAWETATANLLEAEQAIAKLTGVVDWRNL